mmetsp:Transcript_20629/g.83745  ORF Transcript_20629/g.83745 Transcript_20629/m.83745 type:complete len:164 (-) Transcript_20629:2753-3244(-)
MEMDTSTDKKSPDLSASMTTVPEVSAYLQLLCVAMLIDNKNLENAVEASTELIEFVSKFKSRTMDDIGSRAFFFYSRAHELTNNLAVIRPRLLTAYRTAVLRHDPTGQAMLLNLLLRNYIHYKLYDQADKLVGRESNVNSTWSIVHGRFLPCHCAWLSCFPYP